jgi:uncharacterized protein (TIGR04141 family)
MGSNMPGQARRPRTRRQTLYLLSGIEPTVDGMMEALDTEALDGPDYELSFPTVLGVPAIWAYGSTPSDARWCADAATTTGIPMTYMDRHSGGALVLAVDGEVYAVTYGAGRWFIKDDYKDQRFGLRFAIRQLQPHRINRLVQRRPGARGRQDSTLIPGGLPIWSYGLEDYAGIVGHVGGELKDIDLTFDTRGGRPARIDGAAGLNARFGVQPGDFIADIRTIATICRNKAPDPSLEPIENIVPIDPSRTADRLRADLEELLSWEDAAAAAFLHPVVPMSRMDDYLAAQSLAIHIGAASPRQTDHLDLGDFLRRTRAQRPGTRVQALRDGRVHMFTDPDGDQPIGASAAINWLEADFTIGSRRYFLMDGTWYEIGTAYLESLRTQVEQLLSGDPSLDLPAWDPSWHERRYNEHVQDVRPGYLNLDRNLVRAGPHQATGFEVCDVLGPDNELVHIKRAKGSAPLSHLFSQALVSVQALAHNSDARAQFTTKVRDCPKGRPLSADFQPKKVVFGILLKDGDPLNADTLFPFSQVTLTHTARELQSRYQVAVEVITIQPLRDSS